MRIAERDRSKGTLSRQAVVAQAEAFLRTHNAPVPVAALGRIVGMSERGLRSAFYKVHAMSPKRWMVAARLQRARQALCDGDTSTTTVTSVALDHGFFELGRFAASYRGAFGELPSETLRHKREHDDARRT